MKKNLGYHILMAFTLPMQIFSLEFHYFISDILFFFTFHLIKYRRKVVKENLNNSFPNKTKEEINKIEKKFYKGFIDMVIETLYLSHANLNKEGTKRLEIENYNLIEEYLLKKRNVIALAGHIGNWECMQLMAQHFPDYTYFVYKQLNNKSFDLFYRNIRKRAAQPLEMRQTVRQLIKDASNNKNYLAYLISDQRPIPEEIKHWVTFMNQETPVMLGTERIAQKTSAAVFYLEIIRIKRGYFKVTYEPIVENASNSKQYEVTDKFMKRLEKSINMYPEQYFWTHKRWKYKRKDFS